MKLLRALEEQRTEEVFNGTRCKACSGAIGDHDRTWPSNKMIRHAELPEYCKHCGDDVLAPSKYADDEAF